MTDGSVSGDIEKDARSRFVLLVDVLAEKEINTVPHVSIDKIKVPPFGDAKDKNGGDLVRCFVIRSRAPTGEHARKDRHEMAVHEAFVQIVKEEIAKLASGQWTRLRRTLTNQRYQKIRLQIVRMSMQRLETDELVESVLLPL